jgi:hypothetical protein
MIECCPVHHGSSSNRQLLSVWHAAQTCMHAGITADAVAAVAGSYSMLSSIDNNI